MPRSLGKYTIGFDQRSGKKVRYRDLVEDGENPGLLVHRDEADPEHPQKYVRTPGPDQIALFRPAPEASKYSTRIIVGASNNGSNLWADRDFIPTNRILTAASGNLTITEPGYGFGGLGFGASGFGQGSPTGSGYGDLAYGSSGYGANNITVTF